jgi:dipeptidyl aminopeptidase/acylaminoacyl peptidase
MSEDTVISTALSREELILGPRISECCSHGPTGNLVAFTEKKILDGGKKSATNLFLHNSASLRTIQLTHNESGSVSNPVFCVDLPGAEDALLHLKSTDSQVWTIPLGVGESRQVSSFPLPVESFKVFRGTGTKIWMLCVLSVYPGHSPQETVARDKAKEGGSSGMVFDQLMVRHWDTWNCYEKRNHLFLCQLQVRADGSLFAPTERLYDLMLHWESDCPPKPFGGAEEYCPSPDGTTVAMACRRAGEPREPSSLRPQPRDFAWTTCVSVYVLTIPLKLWEMERAEVMAAHNQMFAWQMISAEDNLACAAHPSWSPDGRKLAYLSMHRPVYESDHMQIMMWDSATRKLENVSKHVDLSFGALAWDALPSPKSKSSAATVLPLPRSGAPLVSQKTHGSIAQAAASAMTESDYLEPPEEIVPDQYDYTVYSVAQYRGSGRVFRLSLRDTASGVALHDLSVMTGDETRGAIMLASTTNAFSKAVERVLYYTESTLTSPSVLKAARLTAQAGPEPLFKPFVFAGSSRGECKIVTSEQSPFVRDIHCPNPQYLNGDLSMPRVRQYYFASTDADGKLLTSAEELVHCWYLPPANMQETDKETNAAAGSVPLLLIIHGGPQGAITNSWNYRWNLAYYASQGYGVVAVNFHGSTGFGVRYLDSIRGQWGGQPYRDCMACTDFILREMPYLDASRVGALGASYGGYMINWINGHDSERKFKCMVNHDGIFGLKNLYYTTEELWFPEWEFGVPYITNPSDARNKDSRFNRDDPTASKQGPSQYDLYDPSLFVDQWNTPTLVIQGCKDHRVVETEGIATFTALQRRGIQSKLLVFPDENHWCLRPLNSLKWHTTVTEWLASFLKA